MEKDFKWMAYFAIILRTVARDSAYAEGVNVSTEHFC